MALGPCSSDRPDRARPVTSEPETSIQREIVVMAQLALQEKWRGRGWTVMKKRMGTTARAIFVSLIAAISSSAIFGGLFLIVASASHSGAPPEGSVLLLALSAFLTVALYGLPLSVPLGIVGGLCAAAFLRRELSQTRNRWIGLGGVSGLAVGGLGATVYCLLLNGWFFDFALWIYLSMGSVSGLFAGAAVGLWCARVMRSTQDGTGPGPGGKRPSPTSSRPSAPAPG